MACKDDHDGTGTLESAVIKGDAQDIAYDSDEFRLFVAKIAICPRKAIHVWSECPYVHPGEKARRRDPRLHHYSSQPCPDNSLALQKGEVCPRGDACHYSHNLFETHLHPEMYRTTMCTAGSSARHQLNLNPNELPDSNALQRHVALMQQQARLQLAAQQQQQLQQYMQQQQLYRQQEQQQYMQQQQQYNQPGQAGSTHVDWGGFQGTLAELSDPATALRLLQQQQQQQQQWK
ncbi:hypothetical protein OEZ85_007281 [Tetradesmus obliquus]|uniref:C3H1-type domain-containing protein n=1 Tax=Tetradesmus obliquus TaxID=3088 RepID=A0ABY8TXX7_TETOB|nr:hypothetical protein OEZ85_007281 [Tetradesmus obliquus]